ncbi:hypothetical protein FE257_010425 [Aspergillus nanangensis]|uniref:Xylanolytic transcriptional activator regulatory domain-containing protein n=1 Tax=Aspergillus nanangensis TaxID=2582783 RepID=A0AAD4GS30_ASPNN|nr:hypothetical protein FE257_010425 [Aspergillus nanangensis]
MTEADTTTLDQAPVTCSNTAIADASGNIPSPLLEASRTLTELADNTSNTVFQSPIYTQHDLLKSIPPRVAPQDNTVLTPKDSEVDQEDATIDITRINWEHHGPGSWVSICSPRGIQWVESRVQTARFGQIAERLIMDWTKHLTMTRGPYRDRCPEPDVETAYRYVKSYFDHSPDSMFGVVYRPEFETDLRRHFEGSQRDDVGRYALRNAVYAVGCRCAALGDKTGNFEDVQRRSLQYFHNAFSVYTDVLYMPSGLTAVQALVVMTSYAELLGSPAVEYMLSSSAARLAQSKGLHRQPSRGWKLPAVEILHRNWIFWAVYCHDKYISLRSGRPSVLDDADISCELPTEIPAGSTIDIEAFSAIVKHAKICSDMFKQLFSARAFSQPLESIFANMQGVSESLQQWRNALPPSLQLERTPDEAMGTSPKRNCDRVRVRSAYYGSIIALHASIHYPWVRSLLLLRTETSFSDRISNSSALAAMASREILSSLADVQPGLPSSSPIVFYYPMLAIINLFIYILQDPVAFTAQSDLALLDIAAGHFGQVFLLTSSQVSFNFPRDVVRIAERAIRLATTEAADIERVDDITFTPDTFPSDIFYTQGESMGQDSVFESWGALSQDYLGDIAAAGDMIFF